MVSMLTSGEVDRGFGPWSGQTNDYKIDVSCVSAKHTALRSKSKNWLAWDQDNVSDWSDISHFWDRPVPTFSDVRFSYLALVQDKKNHVRFTGKCMLYSLCQLPRQF
jgi:hypothetical protein